MKSNFDEVAAVKMAMSQNEAERSRGFDLIIRHYHSKLRNLGTKYLDNDHDVDDAITLTTLKAMKAIDQYEHKTSFWSWLGRIHFNVIHDRLRATQREKKRLISIEGQTLPKFESLLVSETASWNSVIQTNHELELIVQAALGRLSEKHKNIIILVFLNGFSYQQVADLLNVQIGTVMSRVSNARKFFIENLNELGFDRATIASILAEKNPINPWFNLAKPKLGSGE